MEEIRDKSNTTEDTLEQFRAMRAHHLAILSKYRSIAGNKTGRIPYVYIRDIEKKRARAKARYRENREEYLAKAREYRLAHLDYYREYSREYKRRKKLERARDTKSDSGGIGIHSGDILAS